jgi:hypothetical protein
MQFQIEGEILVCSMNMRGEWASLPENGKQYIKINVTSAQGKNSKNRLAFSPMTPIPNRYKEFWCFENYWQSLKVFEDIPFEKSNSWFKQLDEPKRRYPKSKGKRVLCAKIETGQELNYIDSRKQVYVPEYYELIKDHEMTLYYKKMLQEGHNLAFYDFDGPRTEEHGVTCLELTEDMIKDKINDPRHPFGHGYIVAATIANIMPEIYIN